MVVMDWMVDGIVLDIIMYSERSDDGRWVIPIAVDYDHTLTMFDSKAGKEVPNTNAFRVMKEWEEKYNCKFILDTLRDDRNIDEALSVIREHGINLYGLRRNPCQDRDGHVVPKIYASYSIDDRNVGIPLYWVEGGKKPHVDWLVVDEMMRPYLEKITECLDKSKL